MGEGRGQLILRAKSIRAYTQFCMSVDRWSLLPFSEAID